MKQFRDSRYWVTKDGKVFAHYPAYSKISSKMYKGRNGKYYNTTKHYPEKWNPVKTYTLPNGYIKCIFYLEPYKQTNVYIHRIVAELYVSGGFEGAHVDHIDGYTTNNHYTNLQWCTLQYNNIKRDNKNYPLFKDWSS